MPGLDSNALSHDIDSPRRLLDRVNMAPFELMIDSHGYIQVPPAVRDTMLANAAGPLIAEVVDGELRLITPKAAIRKVRRLIAEQDWGNVLASEEVILERRAEALRDYAESLLSASERSEV